MSITVTKDNLYSLNLDGISRIKITYDLTNSHLEYLVRNYNLDYIDELIIFGNKQITSIPILPNLTYLDCRDCIKLTNIPLLPNLTILYCSFCANLNNIPILPNLTYLNCEGCSNLNNISILPNLTKLCCTSCTSLTNIPILSNLTELYCDGCNSLTYIPILPDLTKLYCIGCIKITNLPILPELTTLYCCGCNSLLLYTVPLNLISESDLTIELINSAIEYNSNNIDYLQSLDTSNLSSEIVITINDIITSSLLVKPANYK